MTVCFFGNYLQSYPRNVLLKRALERRGIVVVECHTRKRGIVKYWTLYRQHRQLRGDYDFLLVAFSGHTLVWFARLLARKPIIFDVFVSQYVTNIEDRKLHSPLSMQSWYYQFVDWLSCFCADIVLLDTYKHIDFFVRKYRLNRKKFIRVLVGADTEIYKPLNSVRHDAEPLIVHWHGFLVPFHSAETILGAAAILKTKLNIEFRFVTRFTRAYERLRQSVESQGLHSIKFYPEMSSIELAQRINEADICLGIFGNGLKAQLVIPNKIYEAVACAKPVITAEHDVVHEVFTDGKNIVFCKPEDPLDLADKILALHDNISARKTIAEAAFRLSQDELNIDQITKEFIDRILESQMNA